MDDMWVRFTSEMIARVSGPMKFRLVLQPAVAAFFAIRSGLADARAGKPPYFWAMVSDPAQRVDMIKDGWKSVGKVFVLAAVLDVVYQLYVFRLVHPVQAIAVAFILAIVPYLILRGLVTRLTRAKSSRLVLGIAGAIVVLLAVAPFLIPVDAFRPAIEWQASEALGRQVHLGRLRLSLLSGSLSAESLAIDDDPGFSASPFLVAKSVKCDLELLPLIVSHTLHVTGVSIEHPQVTLVRNPAGRWNYSSLGSVSAASSALSIKTLKLKDGQMIVGSATERRRYDHVDVAVSDMSSVTASAAMSGGGTFSLAGHMGPVDPSDLALTPLDATVAIRGLNLATIGILDPSAGLGGVLDLKATIVSRGDQAVVAGGATFSKALLVAGGSPASQPVIVEFGPKYDLDTHMGNLSPSVVRIGGATARLSGTYDARGNDTVVNARITGAQMPARDLESFLPAIGIHLPRGARLAAGEVTANLNVAGAMKSLVATGTVGVSHARLAGFDLGSQMRAISALAGLHTGADLEIQDMTTNLRMAANGLSFDHFNGVIPSFGRLTGAGTIDARNNLHFGMVATLTNPPGGGQGPLGTAGLASRIPSGASGVLDRILGGVAGGGIDRPTQVARISFLVQGPMSNPQFVPDVSGLALQMLEGQFGLRR